MLWLIVHMDYAPLTNVQYLQVHRNVVHAGVQSYQTHPLPQFRLHSLKTR